MGLNGTTRYPRSKYVESFSLHPGRKLAGKYVVGDLIGRGWEGEVYHVTEIASGVERAAKLFFPQRNVGNKALTFYAKKLNKLRNCSIVIQYHTQDVFRHRKMEIPFLVSEYVEGELLTDLVKRQRGKRLHPFEALHIVHSLALGIEEVHAQGEYHGDLHSDNIIIDRSGLGFRVKVVDMYEWGRPTSEHFQDDLCALVRLLYDSLGGATHYAKQPPEIKAICLGLKRGLIVKKFRNVMRFRRHLETMEWA